MERKKEGTNRGIEVMKLESTADGKVALAINEPGGPIVSGSNTEEAKEKLRDSFNAYLIAFGFWVGAERKEESTENTKMEESLKNFESSLEKVG